MAWGEHIKARFPDWGTDRILAIWPSIRQHVSIGQMVSGEVIARAPFGIWIDIGIGHPALLLVPEMKGARERSISFDEYPSIGTTVEARIVALSDRGEIALTQHPKSVQQ
jgi:predicted RNA-binding protein with RPS1 domain